MKKIEKEWKKVNNFPPIIDLAKEKEIVGTLVDIRKEVGRNKSYIYTVESNGEKVSFWGSAGLDPLLTQVAIGNEVKIVYKGMVKTAAKRNMKVFEVYCR